MLKKVRIQIITDRQEIKGSLFETPTGELVPAGPDAETEEETEHLEIFAEGSLRDDGARVSVTYRESAVTGMDGTVTSVSFHRNDPGLITLLRSGALHTSLVFEENRRHVCVYETPICPFEVVVATERVHNTLLEDGRLSMEYTVELRGANAEHTKISITLLPYFKRPKT